MDGRVVGREAELSALEESLGVIEDGFAVVALEGEPGIGKTTVWQEVIRRADARGYRVLSCRPAQSEARLSFAALGDLLTPIPEEALASLPEPQRRALEIALLLADADGPPPDQRTISFAFLSVVRRLAEAGAVLIAVDDAQWLDAPSTGVLEFAARRLDREPVCMLTSIRLSEDTVPVFDRAAGERRQVRRIGPLTVGALHELIKERVGRTFARPTLLRIAQASDGNPFYALEIARALPIAGEPRAGEPLPVPDDLRKLIHARIRALPGECQETLLVASALSAPTLELVDGAALAPAEQADIVHVTADDRVEFAHPLFASAVYASASAKDLRDLHMRLAGVVVNEEERARHLALATAVPDESIAQALGSAADSAAERGALASAAELAELAVSLTPLADLDARHARTLELARRVLEAGNPKRATSILDELVAEAPAGPLRARARLLVALASEWIEGAEAATDLCEQALADANEDVELSAEIHAVASRACDHDSERKLRHARMALDLVSATSPGPQLHAFVLLAAAEASFNAGHGIDYDLLGQTSRLESVRWRQLLANLQLATDELEPARAEYERERRLSAERGDETFLARVLTRMAILELRAGDWDLAEELVSELATIVERTGQRIVRQRSLLLTAPLHSLQGRIEPARSTGAEALALASEVAARWNVAESLAALGFVELSAGDLEAAVAHLDGVDEIYRQIGLGEPRLFRHQADHIETLVGLGELERARSALERLERQGTPVAKPWVDAMATRCRGLLLAAQGDLAAAERSFHQSLGHQRELGLPFELGRTLLCLGRLERRRKQRKAARETLQHSLDVFEGLGALVWAHSASAELDRTHVRQAPHELSPTEQQVARFAASGLKNREIAERMFLSPKTIEANLARVYAKLGIRSRAELGAAMSARSS